MLYSIDAALIYRMAEPCEVLLQMEAAHGPDQQVVSEQLHVGAGPLVRLDDPQTGARQVVVAARDELKVTYAAEVEVAVRGNGIALAGAAPIRDLPAEVLTFLRPSRYCPSDRFERIARRRFGDLQGGRKVEAFIAFVRGHLAYEAGASDRFTTASETFTDGAGVCRDFAHLAITLCRAADIPARAVSAYAWRLDPPDLHAVIEVFLDGRWHLIDPTGKAPIAGLVRIATGRDAADIAFMSIFGTADVVSQRFSVTRLTPAEAIADRTRQGSAMA